MRYKAAPGRLLPKLGGLILGLLVLVAGGGVGWEYTHRQWGGQERFTVVDLAAAPVEVRSFNPQTGRGIILAVPDNLQIATLEGRGNLATVALSVAGSRDWAAQSLAFALGVFSQGDIADLGWWDRFSWWRWQSQVDWTKIDLRQSDWISYVTSVDGTLIGQLKPGWDKQASEWFSSLAIAQEGQGIEVVNSTQALGLAALAARPIESSGIKVSQISQQEDSGARKCKLAASAEQRKLVGLRLLQSQFKCQWQISVGSSPVLYLGSEFEELVAGQD